MHKLILQTILALLLVYPFEWGAAPARAQWSEPVRIGAPGGILYPQILAQGDTLHVVYSNNDQEWKIGYVRSTDGGDTWSEQVVLSDDSSETVFVRIIENGARLMVLWRNNYYYGGSRPRNIGYNISNDNGLSWSGPHYVLDPSWEHILYFSASGSGQVVNIILSRSIGYDLFFYRVRSTNFGQNWSQPVELFRAAEGGICDQFQLADIIHYVWTGLVSPDSQVEIYYMRSTDSGINWSPSIALSDSDQYHSQLPAIAADDSGKVGATWMDFKYAPPGATGDIFLRQSADSGSYWSAEDQLTYNHYAYCSDVILKSDTIHIAWEDWRQSIFRRGIFYIKSLNNGGSWSEPYWIDGTDDDSWNPALAASNGRVYIVWGEGSEESGFGLNFSRYEDETGVIDEGPVVSTYMVLQAYPNPFNSRVMISLNLEEGGDAQIAIYDLNGRLVKTLFKGGILEEGTHKFTWDATDALGKDVSSGSYFAVASTPQGKITQRLTLIR